MKALKIVFCIIVVLLIIFAIYKVYNTDGPNQNSLTQSTDQIQTVKLTNLRIGIAEVDNFNPILSNNKNIQDISRLIFDSLLTLDENYKIQYSLAEEYSKLDDTTYLIKLKDDIKWHDGSNFVASDVQFTIDRLKDTQSIYSYNVQNLIGLEVIDDYTIKLFLDSSVPFFEYNLTFPILSRTYFEGEDFVNTIKNDTLIGTGMYKIVSNENSIMILEKNDDYWNKQEEIVLEEIRVTQYGSMGEVYNAFKIGNIDFAYTSALNIEDYIGTIGYKLKTYPGREFDFICFNCDNKVLKNQEVRNAISYAIDKTNIVSGIFENKYFVSRFPLDYGNWLYNKESSSIGYNTDKVNELLSNSGWTLSNNVWRKTVEYNTLRTDLDLVVLSTNEKRVQVAENIKAQLEPLGIKINIIKASESQYNRYLENKNYEMILTGTYTGFSPDLTMYFGDNNIANYNNDEMKNLISEVKNISDEDLLKEKYNRIIEIYEEQTPYVSLYYNRNSVIYSNNLLADITPNNYNLFYNIYSWYREF